MYETIYSVPGSQSELFGECCENAGPRMEEKFIEATTYYVMEALDVSHRERRLVEPLLKRELNEKLNYRYKRDGLLQQFESYVLETAGERLRRELEIPEDIPINHNHATHAKYADWVDYLKAEDKEEWLEKYRNSKKS